MNRFLFRALLFLSLLSFPQLFAQSPKISSNSSGTIIAPIPFGEKLKRTGLPNFGKINDSLFRGAQPHTEGFQQLKSLGVTTVVDLRGEDPEKISWERKQAETAGMKFVNIPVSGWAPPTNDQVAQFLALFHDPHAKIFVHCRFGDDRTGVFVASYRMAHDHWSPSQAVKEMYFFGFNGFWHPAMKSFIRDFPEKLKTAPALAPFGKEM